MNDDGYAVPLRSGRAEVREKGSRFYAFLHPIACEESARKLLQEVRTRFADASHHCWAWRLGDSPLERWSDAGEPVGTAGMPMLQTLRGAALSDVLAVVVRYFGAVKLGKGGLARAYAAAVREALEQVPVGCRVRRIKIALRVDYAKVGAVKSLLRPPQVELITAAYGEEARLVLAVNLGLRDGVEEQLSALGIDWEERA